MEYRCKLVSIYEDGTKKESNAIANFHKHVIHSFKKDMNGKKHVRKFIRYTMNNKKWENKVLDSKEKWIEYGNLSETFYIKE